MGEENEKNKRKMKLIIFTLIAIISVLLIGIIYQFVTIKNLQKKVENTASYIQIIDFNAKNNLILYSKEI